MKVQVLVTANITYCGGENPGAAKPTSQELREATCRAVADALEFVQNERGFVHGMDETTDIAVDACQIYEEPDKAADKMSGEVTDTPLNRARRTALVNAPSYHEFGKTSAHFPLLTAYSRHELADKLKDWMIELWGNNPKNLDPEQRDQWHRDNGLIYHFICDHFPIEMPIDNTPT